ncbi:uncharacterized protein BX664DRAFT_325709 [Halteromyces radiatus]|uniref:uncharacterized protein n=1 Tax=Halteromyces radiatus TaxID=101107 RepID=UPI00222045B6|nr:uncharacterized protein BX664DRAFT_325709 [Halteromyces radiatus]KAI8097170.1 hypothetical protein BX664DRAFT_325709 [Halteromyces radiatus]
MNIFKLPKNINRLPHVVWNRIIHTRYTLCYVLLTLLSTIVVLILQGLTANLHTQALVLLQDIYVKSGGDLSLLNSALGWNPAQNSIPYLWALLDLKRLKDENIFFVLLRLFQVYFGIDAIVRQSVIQLVAHTILEIMSIVFAGTQLYETNVCKNLATPAMDSILFDTAIHLSIAIISLLSVFTLIFAYLCRILRQEIGWSNYKRLGADQAQKHRYRLAQLFLLILKLDAFFHLVFCVFFFVVMTQENVYKRDSAAVVWYIFHLFVTLVQIPSFLLARRGVTLEKPRSMHIFLVFQVIFMIDFIIILQQTANSWAYWVLAVCLAIALCITTIVLTIYVKRNFNMGLLVHMRHLFDDDDILNNDYGLQGKKSRDSWLIDDDIDPEFLSTNRDFVSTNQQGSNKIEIDDGGKTQLNNN